MGKASNGKDMKKGTLSAGVEKERMIGWGVEGKEEERWAERFQQQRLSGADRFGVVHLGRACPASQLGVRHSRAFGSSGTSRVQLFQGPLRGALIWQVIWRQTGDLGNFSQENLIIQTLVLLAEKYSQFKKKRHIRETVTHTYDRNDLLRLSYEEGRKILSSTTASWA